MRFILVKLLTIAVTLPIYVCAEQGSEKEGFAFAVVGDGPYGDAQERKYQNLIEDVNADSSLEFVIHVGDIKSSKEPCDNELLIRRFKIYQQFNIPFIFTPGDNEWTDCHRTSSGNYNPLERLAFVRQLFYPAPNKTTGTSPFAVETQASSKEWKEYVENTLFIKKSIVFSQIHVVGSHNNLTPWNGIDPKDSILKPRRERQEEFKSRNQAGLSWLSYTFEKAVQEKASAVFITIHANPRFELPRHERAGFNDFIDLLLKQAKTFSKPVFLAQGDFHQFILDNPTQGTNDKSIPYVSNLKRLQTFGDHDVHWVKIEVNHRGPELFKVTKQYVSKNL